MKRRLLQMCLLIAIGLFAACSIFTVVVMPGAFNTQTLDDYHYFLYAEGYYISSVWLLVIIPAAGILCVIFLVWRFRKTMGVGVLSGLLGVALSLGVLYYYGSCRLGIWGREPILFFDVPQNRAAYDRQCMECYESGGKRNCRLVFAVPRTIEPRKDAPAEVHAAFKRCITPHGEGQVKGHWVTGCGCCDKCTGRHFVPDGITYKLVWHPGKCSAEQCTCPCEHSNNYYKFSDSKFGGDFSTK